MNASRVFSLVALVLLTTVLGCPGPDPQTIKASTGGAAGNGGTGGTGGAPCTDPATQCPAPSTACVVAICATGACATENAPVDTACSEGGGTACDGNGACVACTTGTTHCPATGNECVIATCTAGVCGTMNAGDGTATQGGQIAGDCKKQVCDGSGATKVIDDDTDPQDDTNDCTVDTCSGGVSMHSPIAGACNDNGGTVCASPVGVKAGQCVECNVDADCVAPNVCDPQNGTNTCVGAQCTDGAKNGTETDVDCGGACSACPDTLKCANAGDCQSGFCNGGICAPCAGDVDCPGTSFCDGGALNGGTCSADQATGASCTSSSQCVSGNCVDGFCCDTACSGLCQACSAAAKGQGVDGTCGAVASGSDPSSECVANAASTCQQTGACDGAGACQIYAAGVVCAAQSCAGGVQQNVDMCDGAGVCVNGGTTSCGAYTCNAGGTACRVTCALDTECASGNYCNAGACSAKLPNGAACGGNNQCTSAFCTDGVCCGAACGGTCVACNIAGSVGTCSNVASGTDPANECAGADVCNGSGVCKKVNGTACAANSECLGALCIDGFCCNSACGGLCQACNVAGNAGACTSVPSGTDPANECAGATTCNGAGACGLLANGSACTLAGECSSGNCVDGACCNNACGGLCQACNVTGSVGTCTNVPSGTDPANECAGALSCNGAAACTVNNGTACTLASQCQSGNCVDGFCCNSACGALCQACNVAGNIGTCSNVPGGTDPANECAGALTCNGSAACTLNNGAACAASAQCQSGNCVDGVCCNNACGALCQACNIAGSVGTCSNIAANTDPANECAGAQNCNGAGACKGASDGTACTVPSDCASGNCIDGFCCNTACNGTCQACDLAGSVGVCANVPNGADPANECAGSATCNGAGACNAVCHPIGYNACPTGATQFCVPPPLDPMSAAQAKIACDTCYGISCFLETADCAGPGYGPNPPGAYVCGNAYFGYTVGCSGDDGRVWSICGSNTTYGYWGK